ADQGFRLSIIVVVLAAVMRSIVAKEDRMLETYFSAPKTLARLRTGPSGPHVDGFADALQQEGYSQASAVRYLRAATHLGHFLHRRRRTWADVDAGTLE